MDYVREIVELLSQLDNKQLRFLYVFIKELLKTQ